MPTQKLIIFAKNPVRGKVKTRLAATVGEKNALRVYRELLEHTAKITAALNLPKVLYYSHALERQDVFLAAAFAKKVQRGDDLGERMLNAFSAELAVADEVIIMGCDCYELQTHHLERAFNELAQHDVVIGPAKDGGYYLLGMKKRQANLFANKQWGSSSVLADTLKDIKDAGLSLYFLPRLSDVDREEDLGPLRALIEENED